MPGPPGTANGMACHWIAQALWDCMMNSQLVGDYQQGHPKPTATSGTGFSLVSDKIRAKLGQTEAWAQDVSGLTQTGMVESTCNQCETTTPWPRHTWRQGTSIDNNGC